MSKKPPPARPSQNGPGGQKPGAAGPKPGPGGSQPGARADVERAMLLRDVMGHAVKVQREITAPNKRRESHARAIMLGLACTVMLALSAYSWLARPEFIWGPRPAPPSPVDQEAGHRMAMFFLAQRIEAYRRSVGVYPSSLAAIREGFPGLTYRIVGDGVFELRASVAGKQLVFRSDQSVDAFLGNSTNVIQGLGPR